MSIRIASASMPRLRRARNVLASRGMSSRRSRNDGMVNVTTLMR